MDYDALIDEVVKRVLERLREEKKWKQKKRLLTEHDVMEAYRSGITEIKLCEKALVSELAKDCAREKHVALIWPEKQKERPGETF